jgi:hypothetical protein
MTSSLIEFPGNEFSNAFSSCRSTTRDPVSYKLDSLANPTDLEYETDVGKFSVGTRPRGNSIVRGMGNAKRSRRTCGSADRARASR